MIKRALLFIIVCFSLNSVCAQISKSNDKHYFINVFINSEKNIFLENERIKYSEIEQKVSNRIRNKSFKLDQVIVYRIFADENLSMGYIIDVNHKMLAAYKENVEIERYLLNTVELNLDGENWFKSINPENLQKVN